MNVYLPELNRFANVVDNVKSFYMNDDIEYFPRVHSCRNFKWNVALSENSTMLWDNIHDEILSNKVEPFNSTFEDFYKYYQKFMNFVVETNHGNETWIMRGPERLAIVYHAGDSEEINFINDILRNAL